MVPSLPPNSPIHTIQKPSNAIVRQIFFFLNLYAERFNQKAYFELIQPSQIRFWDTHEISFAVWGTYTMTRKPVKKTFVPNSISVFLPN